MSEMTRVNAYLRTRVFALPATVTVAIDPNSFHPSDPAITVAEIEDANGALNPGDEVLAVQRGEDGDPDFVGTASVAKVLDQHGLVYLAVDWNSFRSGDSFSNRAIRRVSAPRRRPNRLITQVSSHELMAV
ncbi:hypothetical protein ACU5JM_19465 [Rhodococcus erythropolis]|uniref:hypothetical protein n=1 Tax=Rhodococcus erythropolis TaxID=1833 RepID=UPI00406BB240